MNNQKQIAIAMHNYLSAFDTYPPAAKCDASGKPLLSWRVLILPYLEHTALYNQFHLDEPWDSPNNRPLVDRMPDVFKCPSNPQLNPGETAYEVVVDPSSMFTGEPTGVPLSGVTDGTANTLTVVEAASPVPWSKPQDLSLESPDPLVGMGSKHPGGFNASMADGSIRFFKTSGPSADSPETLKLARHPQRRGACHRSCEDLPALDRPGTVLLLRGRVGASPVDQRRATRRPRAVPECGWFHDRYLRLKAVWEHADRACRRTRRPGTGCTPGPTRTRRCWHGCGGPPDRAAPPRLAERRRGPRALARLPGAPMVAACPLDGRQRRGRAPARRSSILPGPNLIGYWFAYRAIHHPLIVWGIRRVRRNAIPTELHPSRALDLPIERDAEGKMNMPRSTARPTRLDEHVAWHESSAGRVPETPRRRERRPNGTAGTITRLRIPEDGDHATF